MVDRLPGLGVRYLLLFGAAWVWVGSTGLLMRLEHWTPQLDLLTSNSAYMDLVFAHSVLAGLTTVLGLPLIAGNWLAESEEPLPSRLIGEIAFWASAVALILLFTDTLGLSSLDVLGFDRVISSIEHIPSGVDGWADDGHVLMLLSGTVLALFHVAVRWATPEAFRRAPLRGAAILISVGSALWTLWLATDRFPPTYNRAFLLGPAIVAVVAGGLMLLSRSNHPGARVLGAFAAVSAALGVVFWEIVRHVSSLPLEQTVLLDTLFVISPVHAVMGSIWLVVPALLWPRGADGETRRGVVAAVLTGVGCIGYAASQAWSGASGMPRRYSVHVEQLDLLNKLETAFAVLWMLATAWVVVEMVLTARNLNQTER